MEQLKEAVEAINAPALSEEEIKMLREAIPVNIYEQHR
jgi:hypothetical protein